MAEIITMPKLGFDMAEGTLVRWVIFEGEPVVKGNVLAEIETDKATVEVEADLNGILYQHLVPVGETIPVNTPIAVVASPDEEVDLTQLLGKKTIAMTEEGESQEIIESSPEEEHAVATVEGQTTGDGKLPGGVRASPLARRMAERLGINLNQVDGTGSSGRITKKDVESYIKAPAEAVPAAAKPSQKPSLASAVSISTMPPSQQTSAIQLSRLRSAIGRRMAESKQLVPHFYVTHEYDMQPVLELRKQINSLLTDEERISVNVYIVRASALALRQFPNLNASLDKDQVIHHGQVNIGVAVAVEGGLLTIVCHDTDRKSLRQISDDLRILFQRARQGKVRPDDIEGSTFTVSNMGMYDVEHFIAIINPPEAAILAVGSALEVPVVKNGEIESGIRMKATISVDHRVSDGAEAARFLQALAGYLENPLLLLV